MDGELPKSADGKALNLDFEKGNLDDWKAEGTAFAGQPIRGDAVNKRRNDMKSGHQGEFWIGGFEPRGTNPSGDDQRNVDVGTFYRHPPLRGISLRRRRPRRHARRNRPQSSRARSSTRLREQNVENLRQHVDRPEALRQSSTSTFVWSTRYKAAGGTSTSTTFVFMSQPGPSHRSFSSSCWMNTLWEMSPLMQAAKAMKLPPGFSVVVAANEPEITQPIAMALDDRGRLWVAEAYEYPIRAEGDKGARSHLDLRRRRWRRQVRQAESLRGRPRT